MTTRVALVTGCGKRDSMGRAIALSLASAGTGYMTGQTLVLDGGAGSSMFAKKPPEAQKI